LLKSKLTAYNEWMQIYQSTLKSRLDQYGQIKRSKEFVINQTKESWKPHITQYKLFKDALSSAGKLKNEVSFFMKQIGSQEPFESFMVNYLVKGLTDPHQTMAPNQFVREAEMDGAYGKYGCYDKFMREELVFNFDHGLICDFPWITEEWVEKEVKAITSAGYWKKNKLYFNFFKLQSNKTITELPLGNGNAIMEDADIIASMFVMSRNVMAAKMLELAAKEEEAVLYVDKMLGLVPKVNGRKIIKYETKGFNYVVGGNVYDSKAKLLETFPKDKFNLVRHKKPSKLIESIKDMFFINFDFRVPGGPYEHQFHRSLNKIFLKGPVIQRYNGLCGLILKRMNIEGPITPLQSEGMKIFQDQINRDQ
ncbi:MAG: hypothetical protein KAQ92_02010, partial [Candidatus Aenigmarchaeota archaeon]|nr:hypothetical protein [Candidatus Aenigmarchaeota archaeon]